MLTWKTSVKPGAKKNITDERISELQKTSVYGLEKFSFFVPISIVDENFINPDSSPIEKKTLRIAM